MYRLPRKEYNRAQRSYPKPVLPERLQRLNRELSIEKTKSFDYLNAVHGDFRVRVCVMRDEDNQFFATAQTGERAFRVQGGSPSGAFWMLSIVMRVYLADETTRPRTDVLYAGRP